MSQSGRPLNIPKLVVDGEVVADGRDILAGGNLSDAEPRMQIIWQGNFRGTPCRVRAIDNGVDKPSYNTEIQYRGGQDAWRPAIGSDSASSDYAQQLVDHVAGQLMIAGLVRGHREGEEAGLRRALDTLPRWRWILRGRIARMVALISRKFPDPTSD